MDEKPDPAAEFGKKLGGLFKRARPTAERLARDAGPIASKAGRQALEFAREHDDEARQIAQKLVRARFKGPLGMVLDAVLPKDSPASKTNSAAEADASRPEDPPIIHTCPNCTKENPPLARFCYHCGESLAPSDSPR